MSSPIKKCPFCDQGLDNLSGYQRSNHVRWCFQNPKSKEYRAKLIIARAARKDCKNQFSNRDWSQISWTQLTWKRKRQRVLEEANYACEICGFNEFRLDGGPKCIIQIDHIDGDHDNNARSNFRALCPNCHAIHSHKFMFYNRKHSGDMTRFDTSKSRCSVMDNTSTSEVEDSGFESQ